MVTLVYTREILNCVVCEELFGGLLLPFGDNPLISRQPPGLISTRDHAHLPLALCHFLECSPQTRSLPG